METGGVQLLNHGYEPIIVARKPFKGTLVDNIIENNIGGLNIDECRLDNGRFPANVILTYDEDTEKEVCGNMPYSKGASSQNNYSNGSIYRGQSLNTSSTKLTGHREWYNDEGSASRYFYHAKTNKKDRNEGLDKSEQNDHPTVKPTELMQYLIKLVSPKNAVILDPFMGTGSTGKALLYENYERDMNYKFIGIELNKDYVKIADKRIGYVLTKINNK